MMQKQVMVMNEITPAPRIRKFCHRCGQILKIHDDTVWTDNKTYHYGCWIKENDSRSWNTAAVSGMQSGR